MNPSPRILLVDDDDDLRLVLKQLLESGGYRVVGSSQCGTAIELLRDESFDMVLLDITLPDNSGFGVLEFLKANNLPTKVIVITGTVGLENAIRSAALGVLDYIVKPFAPHYLLRSIQHALEV